jgi:hypothetical protein
MAEQGALILDIADRLDRTREAIGAHACKNGIQTGPDRTAAGDMKRYSAA